MLSEAGGAVFIKDSKICTKKLSRVLMVKALPKLISSHVKHILWPTADKFVVNCCKVSNCLSLVGLHSLHLHEENWSRLTGCKHSKRSFFHRGSIT